MPYGQHEWKVQGFTLINGVSEVKSSCSDKVFEIAQNLVLKEEVDGGFMYVRVSASSSVNYKTYKTAATPFFLKINLKNVHGNNKMRIWPPCLF